MIRARSQHGISTFIAIAMLALVGITLVSIERHFAVQVQRTHRLAAETQLRQLLLAGTRMVDPAGISEVVSQPLPLPPQLSEATLTARLQAGDDPQQRCIELTATLGRYVTRQILLYQQAAGGQWVLREVKLEQLS